jgi:hypothetical protein
VSNLLASLFLYTRAVCTCERSILQKMNCVCAKRFSHEKLLLACVVGVMLCVSARTNSLPSLFAGSCCNCKVNTLSSVVQMRIALHKDLPLLSSSDKGRGCL